MKLSTHISDLLYRYECVIVPGFGGFVTRKIPSKIDEKTHSFYPPSKQVTFNSQLKNNDGLLANYLAVVSHTTYELAVLSIEKEVETWKKILQTQELELKNIGSFSKKEGVIVFEPFEKVNYLTASYGLAACTLPKTKVIAVDEKSKKSIPVFIKYAAVVAILLALGSVGFGEYQKYTQEQLVAKAQQEQAKVEKSIQEATFVIKTPLPAITVKVAKKVYPYHIVAGAFRNPKNAIKKVKLLSKKGYNARILGKNKWGLTQVCYASFDSKREAINMLYSIQRKTASDAWLLIEDL